ncbi:hypothetical protein CRG98_026026 [Punica granatum]|uniref:GDSL esterase/lipase At5g45670-like n=1 Tax=Punica granatum TaxID=22663 RepID=A0A2I0JD34_PUNGR|nr:hypothetical protein CRG98_026026 [Punica granatum]
MGFDSMRRILLAFLFFTQCLHDFVQGAPQVPCYFIFGDSLADCGNNNNLNTLARPNYYPYGLDFPKGPTGRFTNGRTVADVIGELLGFDHFIPPFTNLTGADVRKGVNYASSASGIRDETGMQQGERVSLNEQLKNHFSIVSQIISISSNESAAKGHLEKCIYIVITGNNDYMNNYFMPEFYPTSKEYTPQQYADVLVKQYSEQLKLFCILEIPAASW